ncbi:DUF6476 family protein [Phaeobacter sp. PT47_59]|uniref:DUF6476 family protein n=1 Tax=Phaeobacter sp. PT47_59 TaxID=3029979 RepID=UPI0023804B8A|nr:DUF6476 family protein [Phaeobacter sp. PT47_59]MDE4176461.1 DUF6476 family protein [Phaeobacter sp. PT47_59]
MTDPSQPELQDEPPQLKFLRRLVTTLTVVMIGGLVVVIALLVIRLSADPVIPGLPEHIALPEGAEPQAVTFGDGWVALVTTDNRILVFDAKSGALRQSLTLD